MDKDRLKEIINNSQFELLMGENENEWFDCKGQPYSLEAYSKRELCKDVSSFANVSGGYIFIGICTAKADKSFGDIVEGVRPFSEKLINIQQYLDVIKEGVYPDIRDISIEWKATDKSNDKGIVIITVPEQDRYNKPFLIKKTIDNDKKKSEIMFGFAERIRDSSQPYNISNIHTLIKNGMVYVSDISTRLDNIEKKINAQFKPDREKKTIIKERLQRTLEENLLTDEGVLALSLYLEDENEILDWGLQECKIKNLIEEPPTLRINGWDLRTLESAKFIAGDFYRVSIKGYKAIDIYRDGTLIFAAATNESFLSWNSNTEKLRKLHTLALVEVIYNYSVLANVLIDSLKNKPDKFSVKCFLDNMKNDNYTHRLAPYVPWDIRSSAFDGKEAPATKCDDKYYYSKQSDPGVLGFNIVKEIYNWFGYEGNEIPFTRKNEDGIFTIDEKLIVDIK